MTDNMHPAAENLATLTGPEGAVHEVPENRVLFLDHPRSVDILSIGRGRESSLPRGLS